LPPARESAAGEAAIPDKPYFKIGEVARLVGVEPYVLRYWQTEFPSIRPQKSRTGHRVYRRRDVERLVAIRRLLHREGFTIAGARRKLREAGADGAAAGAAPEGPGLDSSRASARAYRGTAHARREDEELLRLVDDDGRRFPPPTER
jgi:DNA-binding transcriptional MerR regulator